MSHTHSLPTGFESLEPFVDGWSITGAAKRAQYRIDSSETDRIAFFNAAKELAAPALALLDQKPLDQFDDQERRLMNLLLSLAHVALAIEIQADDELKHARFAKFMKIARAPSDV